MEQFTTLTSTMVSIPIENIDTDQIIPAQFLKGVDRDGLGEHLFHHWRSDSDFILNQPAADKARILVAGDNFGCGSSREHAVWALMGQGFQVVISTGFADIFQNNALKNGLLPITVDAEIHRQIQEMLADNPAQTFAVDLEAQTLTLPDGQSVEFPIDSFSKKCILEGIDPLGYLQSQAEHIAAYEDKHAARVETGKA
ncbi:MAG: 3-isopropylmalate dehydratase small subunit (EC 4.2.1.33) [Olavius algarvensis Delta 4 endosymbiont]|nr:MAG: 3-isopropylmalate dehydratase small subunit (EC 4.2.1.33) [Olavius algarvensis Delta 4 endosymbiont]